MNYSNCKVIGINQNHILESKQELICCIHPHFWLISIESLIRPSFISITSYISSALYGGHLCGNGRAPISVLFSVFDLSFLFFKFGSSSQIYFLSCTLHIQISLKVKRQSLLRPPSIYLRIYYMVRT